MSKTVIDTCCLPAAYKNELWYSVISRYHRHSGNTKALTTKRELFGTTTVTLNPLSVEGTMIASCADADQVIQKHTVEPYVLRYYGVQRKQEIRQALLRGDRVKNRPSIKEKEKSFFRYCPLCCDEDEASLGELYWHREHQIPEVQCCPRHGCMLEDTEIAFKYSTYHFCAADRINCPLTKPRYEVSQNQLLYAKYVYECLNRPLSFTKQTAIHCLKDVLMQNNVIRFTKSGFVCRCEELYEDLCTEYGEERTGSLFTKESLTRNIRRLIFDGSFFSAGHIILLAAHYKIPYDRLFSCEEDTLPNPDPVQVRIEKVREMSRQGYRWSLQLAAKHLGVSADEFRRIVKLAGVDPFWEERHAGKGNHVVPQIAVKMYVTESERERIRKRAEELGMSSTAEYLRYCVQKDSGMIQ